MSPQCTVRTGTLAGVQMLPVDVEVDVGAGLPSFAIVGLADAAVQEARERVRSAIRASGFDVPNARIVVNLAPAPLRKHGTGFDLPIALGILGATGQIPRTIAASAIAVGELSLDGSLRRIPGLVAYALASREAGATLLGPRDAGEDSLVPGLDFRGLDHLGSLRAGLPSAGQAVDATVSAPAEFPDFHDVVGQTMAVRALVAAAAGAHNVLLIGPPGSGKTMLARRLSSILPPLRDDERLETAVVHSVAGIDSSPAWHGVRPFRAPHHSATIAGIVGGGSPPRPGEASLAHNGVLFLDEMPEFGPAALQCLRQPLEDGSVTLVRAEGRLRFPARFSLVGAANPCPCGFFGDSARECTCPPSVVERYRTRIGGPLMDRIDLVCDVWRPDPALLLAKPEGESSASLAAQVQCGLEFASHRGLGPSSRLSGPALLAACRLDSKSTQSLEEVARIQHLSGRAITRLLRVARTFADLDESDRVRADDLAEALSFRAHPGR